MDPAEDMYDEGTELDQERTVEAGSEETEDVGEPFLAPKASFKGDLAPGTIHRVRIEASQDEELTLVCLGPEAGEPEEAASAPVGEESELYE